MRVLIEKALVADVLTLMLSHGQFLTRQAQDSREAHTAFEEWRPQLAVARLCLHQPPFSRR
ncbi:MAG TPA: hypothetical protein VKT80_01495, partial [Chloroflexota bacterium]|nr:hypothetical protein [Chloroflexota bacterium]